MMMTLDVISMAYKRCIPVGDKYRSIVIDYLSVSYHNYAIADRENWIEIKLDPFGNEGLYLNFYLHNGQDKPVYCGCLKTLDSGMEAYGDLGALLGEMTYWCNKLIWELMKDQ